MVEEDLAGRAVQAASADHLTRFTGGNPVPTLTAPDTTFGIASADSALAEPDATATK
jgi:hypothetical protein